VKYLALRHAQGERTMKLHEPVDMGCEAADLILYYGKSLVRFLSKITNIKLDKLNSPINLAESCVYPPKPRIYPAESRSYQPFQRRELLIDAARLFSSFLFRHLSYLAALGPFKSQELKSKII
jgi:hypothetical protein